MLLGSSQLALINEYASGGYRHLRQVKALNDDLDGVSEGLVKFKLDLNYPRATTEHPSGGGAEYCAEVIKRALDELAAEQESKRRDSQRHRSTM